MPALIIWGFIYHYLFFKIIPIDEILYLVFGYLALATFSILFTYFYDEGKISQKLRYVRLFIPLLLQFSLGSIIGGVFIFYWFSGSFFVSWPFILVVVALMVLIEVYKHYLEQPVVQFGLYSFSAFLLLAVALPYFFRSLDSWLFVAAGAISFFLVLLLTILLGKSQAIKAQKYRILAVSAFVFIGFNVFYFLNLIPPVPLSIRDAGVYHSVIRTASGYELLAEPQNWWQKITRVPTIHLAPEESAYVFTSIYSPADLNTDIVHEWQHYDEKTKKWTDMSEISFHVTGGRQEGYRGYSFKSNVLAGKWRVFVETPRGQVLGRYEFNAERVDQQPVLVKEIE